MWGSVICGRDFGVFGFGYFPSPYYTFGCVFSIMAFASAVIFYFWWFSGVVYIFLYLCFTLREFNDFGLFGGFE